MPSNLRSWLQAIWAGPYGRKYGSASGLVWLFFMPFSPASSGGRRGKQSNRNNRGTCIFHRLHTRALINLPAVSEWSDFDDRHKRTFCVSREMRLSVHVNVIQIKNDQDRFTAERVLRTRPKTYRAI